MIIERLRYIVKHDLIKNFSVIFSGTAISQLVLIGSLLFTGRLYTPADFGVLASINAIVSVWSSICSLNFNQALTICTDDAEADHLYRISNTINLASNLILLPLIILVVFTIEIPRVSLLIPAWSFFLNWFQTSVTFKSRLGRFPDISRANVYKSTIASAFQVAAGFIIPSATTLVLTKIAGDGFSAFILDKKCFPSKNSFHPFRSNVFNKYKRFSLVATPGSISWLFSKHHLPIAINYLFGNVQAGLLSMANRILYAPTSIVLDTMTRAFEQRALSYSHSRKKLLKLAMKTSFGLGAISLMPTLIIFSFSEKIFVTTFGESWRESAQAAKWLSPTLFFSFTAQPYILVLKYINGLHLFLRLSIFENLLSIMGICLGYYYDQVGIAIISNVASFSITRVLMITSAYILSSEKK